MQHRHTMAPGYGVRSLQCHMNCLMVHIRSKRVTYMQQVKHSLERQLSMTASSAVPTKRCPALPDVFPALNIMGQWYFAHEGLEVPLSSTNIVLRTNCRKRFQFQGWFVWKEENSSHLVSTVTEIQWKIWSPLGSSGGHVQILFSQLQMH